MAKRKINILKPPKAKRKISLIDIGVAFGVILIAAILTLPKKEGALTADNAKTITGFAKINDGDSITINRQKIRLIDIDAPELQQDCQKQKKKYACGQEAKKHLQQLINKRKVTCYWQKRDQYKRYLANCQTDTIHLNQQMIIDGYAISFHGYKQQEAQAKKQQKGMWQYEFIAPYNWRKQHSH